VVIEPGSAFFTDKTPETEYYRLAYSSIDADKIPSGLERIARAISAS